jgi:hypothetical protein
MDLERISTPHLEPDLSATPRKTPTIVPQTVRYSQQSRYGKIRQAKYMFNKI